MDESSEQPHVSITICIILIVAIILLPICTADWVWDDRYLFINNPAMEDLSLLLQSDLFSPTGQGNSNVYRPLVMLSYWIQSLVSETAMFAHSVNLLIHCCVVGISLHIMLALGTHWKVSAMLALLLGLHPGTVEAVAWVSGRQDMLPTSLLLLGCLYWLRNHNHRCGFIWALTPFCKEPYLLIPILVLLLSLAKRKMNWTVFGWTISGTFAYQICRVLFEHTTPISAIFEDPIGSFGAILWRGVQLLWIPTPHPTVIFSSQFTVGLIAIIACLLLLFSRGIEAKRTASHFWLGATLLLFPAGIAAQQSGLIGDRYLYHWIVITVISLAPFLSVFIRNREWLLWISLSIIALISLQITRPYAMTWQSDSALFQWAWEQDEGNPYVAFQLGYQAHIIENNCAKAMPYYQIARPVDIRAANNLQACLLDSNQIKEAIALGEELIQSGTVHGTPYANTARAYTRQNDYPRARPLAEKAVSLDSDKASYWILLGNIVGRLQEIDKALEAFEQALRLEPENQQAQQGRTLCLTLLTESAESKD